MIHYISLFTSIFYLSQFPLSYFLYRKKDKFKCIGCGECCYLKFKLKKSDIERFERGRINWKFFVDENWRIKKTEKYCYLLKDKNGRRICSINKYKPDVCRKWPFFNQFSISWAWIIKCPSLRKLIFD